MVRHSLRCLFSSHSDIIVASLEFLEKVLSLPILALDVECFYPQQLSAMNSVEEEQGIVVPTSLSSSRSLYFFLFWDITMSPTKTLIIVMIFFQMVRAV